MADFLTAVTTRKVKSQLTQPTTANPCGEPAAILIESPEDALKALKSQPDYETVKNLLRYLEFTIHSKDAFSVAAPGPLSAQIISVLVNTTIPDYWRALKQGDGKGAGIVFLIKCLKNVSGLGAIIARLRTLVVDSKQKKSTLEKRDPSQQIEDFLDVLSRVLTGERVSWDIWTTINQLTINPTQRTLLWKEFVVLIASGKILALVAQAEDALKDSTAIRLEPWLARGTEYASWLGDNIATIIKSIESSDESAWKAVTQLCGKAFTLGYTDRVVAAMHSALFFSSSNSQTLLPKLAPHEQRQFLNSTISYITKQYFGLIPETKDELVLKPSKTISGAACFINGLISDNEFLKDHLVSLLTSSAGSDMDGSLAVRRSVIAAISNDRERIQNIMERSIELFGDQLYIRHTPTLQQEALAQTLLISCGYVHRDQPMYLFATARSSIHLNGMSNRIGASSPRARFLGIVVGMAISELIDKPDNRMNFELDGDEASEAKWYQQLTHVEDKLGGLKDLEQITRGQNKANEAKIPHRPASGPQQSKGLPPKKDPKALNAKTMQLIGPRIIELEDDSEDDDLVPYAKPDSDPEDDYDDPTMIQRNKPTAPVYIRDLIAGLRDNENYDRHQLALSTAASLIRRKANFGSEVSDHIEELASILVGLNDSFELPNFPEMRQQALIAVLITQPAQMGQWFARAFFSGDYSLTQRVAMLTTMGLGARELAGFKDDERGESTSAQQYSFPSGMLPPKLHKIYAAEATPVNALAKRLEHTMIEPMALNAADKLSGPNALKVRTFSSRMEVEKKRKKPIPNALAKIVAQNFFFPLTGRWWTHMQASDPDSLYTSPHLLPPYLQTLSILLHASGPSTLSLPQMTSEFWDLLLSVRGAALADPTILSTLLFAFLTLLDINEDKQRLAQEQPKELLETQEWVRGVFERLAGGGDEDEKTRMLAAGVLVRCGEVVEKYQRTLVGDMMDF
ncbi:hypothetical protein AOQ84DRAFT_329877 [Glonium stellatum]|uniref:Telomere length regulation protein conserved domain-containing protein n=1 Tax=Glonium stellatum TaxID=574774 RepID=A0A8E2FE83_9PEZI|nr:hypothetical protein AOQ84DRAFT_329877 [Glonium stellatum]